jgi:glucose-6-phosphate isomerase
MKELAKAVEYHVGLYQSTVEKALEQVRQERIISRIWAHDHTVWKPEPTEIANRLGWLHSSKNMHENVGRITAFAEGVRESGYTEALLLGMGGSSLAPDVLRKTFGVKDGYLDLAVLDSTDPGAILAHAERLDPVRTVFIVSTKSGTTVETLSLFKYFYNRARDSMGEEGAGGHFIAVTDPDTPLVDMARRYHFRDCFLNDPNIGGRYSALSFFGLVPAALIGMDLGILLSRAAAMAGSCATSRAPGQEDNPGARLGVILGQLAQQGRDKVTLISSPLIESFGDWVEQLIAESTGKEGRGIVPVVGESIGSAAGYGEDRLFVYTHLIGDEENQEAVEELEGSGHPMVRLSLEDLYDLGGQFFLWEMAVALTGHRLGINPFDQPDVEAAKALARQAAVAYKEKGSLPLERPTLSKDGIAVYGEVTAGNPSEALTEFLGNAQEGAYVSIQAFLQPTPDVTEALHDMRAALRDRFRLPITLGFGPRYLHSTGQLHKGDAGKGLFVQFTADDPQDAEIPDEAGSAESSMSFGVLKAAQALGDRQALIARGRKLIRFHLEGNPVRGIRALVEGLR